MFRHIVPSAFAFAAFATAPQLARADECSLGQGDFCDETTPCAGEFATTCIENHCQVPCNTGNGNVDPTQCSLGEVCAEGVTIEGYTENYCRPMPFTMDLNLLDTCVAVFLEETSFELENGCNYQALLESMLDRNGDAAFNVFDLDLCVKDFLDAEPCDVETQSCPDGSGLIYCATDNDCGVTEDAPGLFCDQELNRCVRECGDLTIRQASGSMTVERTCAAGMLDCDPTRGRCDIDRTGDTCSLDSECPSGGYCFLGECQQKCYRNLDCPDDSWTCNASNRCTPAARNPDDTEAFDPSHYTVSLVHSQVSLDPRDSEVTLPFAIMNQIERREVANQPNVVFGYRAELTDMRKLDDKCFGDFSDLSPDDAADCTVSPEEEFLTLVNPFGTIFGDGDPNLQIFLNEANAGRLSPGQYQAKLKVLFSNGGSTSANIVFTQPTIEGDYRGSVVVYLGPTPAESHSSVGQTQAHLQLELGEGTIDWTSLLEQEGVDIDDEDNDPFFVDRTSGTYVQGYLVGGESLMFNRPDPSIDGPNNRIPFKGIYSESDQALRLISVIDLPADFCASPDGNCSPSDDLRAENPFRRDVRRVLEFFGNFDAVEMDFRGQYRETFFGLLPEPLTVKGTFALSQSHQEDFEFGALPQLVPASDRVDFPTRDDVLATINPPSSCPMDVVANETAYADYLSSWSSDTNAPPLFKELVSFDQLIQNVLDTLSPSDHQGVLSLMEFFGDEVAFCGPGVPTPCVDQDSVECGLTVYQTALVSDFPSATTGTIPLAQIPSDDPDDAHERRPTLFCPDLPGLSDAEFDDVCPTSPDESSRLVTLQEYARFYQQLTQTHTFQANSGLSEVFYKLYKVAQSGSGTSGSAIDENHDALLDAIGHFEAIDDAIFAPAPSLVMFEWPMDSFAQSGLPWLQQMHTASLDRLGAVRELYQLRRRIYRDVDSSDQNFIGHLAQSEYLRQIFIAAIQQRWERESFLYGGESKRAFETVDTLLATSDPGRNPLGLHPNRVYFENPVSTVSTWQHYQQLFNAKLASVEIDVSTAIQNLESSWADQANAQLQLLQVQHAAESEIDLLCGSAEQTVPPECIPPTDADGYSDSNEEALADLSCAGSECNFEWSCANESCDEIEKYVRDAAGNIQCELGDEWYSVSFQGQDRPCINGQVGSLIREKSSVKLQMSQALERISEIGRDVERLNDLFSEVTGIQESLFEYTDAAQSAIKDIEDQFRNDNLALNVALSAADVLDCLTVAGVSVGSTCPGEFAKNGLEVVAHQAHAQAESSSSTARFAEQQELELRKFEAAMDTATAEHAAKVSELVAQVNDEVRVYELLAHQYASLEAETQNLLFLAGRASQRYAESLESMVDVITGSQAGDALFANQAVISANEGFDELMLLAYKMTRSFAHRYNLGNEAIERENRLFRIITLQDLQEYVSDIADEGRSFCGANGFACDSASNDRVYRFSVRNELFPDLKDIVIDASAGNVVTAEQQFHNIITSEPFLTTVSFGGIPQKIIKIPLSISLMPTFRGSYMLPVGECNQTISPGRDGVGSIAVNLIGTRLDAPSSEGPDSEDPSSEDPSSELVYQLWRGEQDFARSCSELAPGGTSGYAVNNYTITWSTEHTASGLKTPPPYFDRSDSQPACIEHHGEPIDIINDPNCQIVYASERTLASTDWVFVIAELTNGPYVHRLINKSLPEEKKPIIEDIEIYFRYDSWPLPLDSN